MAANTEWYKDNFLISTNPSLIQAGAVNAAFDSDLMYCKYCWRTIFLWTVPNSTQSFSLFFPDQLDADFSTVQGAKPWMRAS